MSLLSALSSLLHPPPPADTATRRALDRVAALLDPAITAGGDLERWLTTPIHHALGYCEGLVAGLPGPLTINRQAFANEPLIHALFATPDDVIQMLGKSQAVRDYLSTPACWDSDHFFALLAARRQEKRQLGMAVTGEVVQNDVAQTVVYFSDHTLVEPHCQLENTLTELHCLGFDSLLKSFQAHVDALRLERDGLRSGLSTERAHLAILRGATPGPEYEVHTRHLEELENHLREVAGSLEPEHLVQALASYLLAPETALGLEPVQISIDRMGIVGDAQRPDVDTLSFPELRGRDQRRHLVMLVRIDRREAAEAVETVLDQRRRFMLI